MAEDGMMRASDSDRDAVVSVLRDAYTAGRLTLEEFTERTSAAYAGRTWGELRELTSDLPEQPPLGADVPPRPVAPPDPADLPPGAPHFPDQPSPAGGRPRRRQRPAGAVMPFVMVWFLIVLATRSPAAAAAPVVVLVLMLMFTAVSRRK